MKHNFIELLNAFYDLDIPKCLDPASSFLFVTLLRKFNSTKNKVNGDYFPEALPIYNSELCSLMGCDERNLRRIRQRLIEFKLVPNSDNTWLVKYINHGTHKAGIYNLNYELLESFDYGQFGNVSVPNEKDYGQFGYQIVQVSSKKDKVTDNLVTNLAELDPKNEFSEPKASPLLQQNKTKQNTTSFPCENLSISTKKENDDIDDVEKKEELDFQETKKMLQRICPSLSNSNIAIGKAIRKISGYPIEQREKVIEKAGLSGCTAGNILAYVQKGLEGYKELYGGGNGGIGKADKIKEELDARYSSEEYWQERQEYEEEAKRRTARLIKEAEERQERRVNANKGTDAKWET